MTATDIPMGLSVKQKRMPVSGNEKGKRGYETEEI
jgi:hypothetical protein